ncbi:hypothetical protein QAD02_006414 [Eretmocerus hayati]|uniref:Uncharacterized protein n=1 Tax=Eretmocerus hayati TaxID=131215 RepID=A0ACC2N347_9HYME|nr:hypothetical protein QAD02_006414 [Eretmocerus hayati]
MGVFKLTILGLIALAVSTESSRLASRKSYLKEWKCPKKDIEGVVVRFPHEIDCHRYYECHEGKLIEEECDDGLNFDPMQKECEFIDEVECYQDSSTTITETPATTVTTTRTTHTQSPTTTTVAPTKTTNKITTTPVTESTVTEDPTKSTKAPTTVPTSTKIPTTLPTTTIKPEPPTTKKPSPEDCIGTCPAKDPEWSVQIPHKDCTKFCKCSNGRPFVMSCSSGLEFNSDLQTCVWPWQSTCPDHNLLKPIQKKSMIQKRQAIYSDDESIEEDEDIDVPSDVVMEPLLTTIPEFNPKTCIGRCPDLDPLNYTVQLPNEECNKFCKCSNGKSFVIPCPEGLEYSRELEVCTWPTEADCKSSTTPLQPTTTSPPKTTIRPKTTDNDGDLTTTLSPVPFKILKQIGRKVNDTNKSVLLLKIVEDKDQDESLIDKFKSLFKFQ